MKLQTSLFRAIEIQHHTAVVFVVALSLYLFFPTKNYYWDGIDLAPMYGAMGYVLWRDYQGHSSGRASVMSPASSLILVRLVSISLRRRCRGGL
jgi:hypothetical protein